MSQEHPPPQKLLCNLSSSGIRKPELWWGLGSLVGGQQDEDNPPARAERPTEGQDGPLQSSATIHGGSLQVTAAPGFAASTQPFLSLLSHNSMSANVWQTPSKAHDTSGLDSHLLLWIRASPAALPTSPAGEASRAWKSQYWMYSPQITELTALNKRCAGEGEDMGCALQLCQYRLCCPLQVEEK